MAKELGATGGGGVGRLIREKEVTWRPDGDEFKKSRNWC